MEFELTVPTITGPELQLQLKPSEILFVLGANGTGKSSLMSHFYRNFTGAQKIKISAHRQNWMNSNTIEMSHADKINIEEQVRHEDLNFDSRNRDFYASARANMAIYDIVEAQNIRARKISDFVDAGNMKSACEASRKQAPITVINELFRLSNISITISIKENECIVASKGNGPEYSVVELSDGERNALMIASNILTAPADSLVLIDEPERHLHRSIVCPLLKQLFEHRPDCGFVISTHDHNLPVEVPGARMLLLRSFTFNQQNIQSWEVDEVPIDNTLEDTYKLDLLGARRKILFVEGTDRSLDKPLYRIVFPMVSVIPKSSRLEVERAVAGMRAAEDLHWLRAFGIVDGDGYDSDQTQTKTEIGVYALPYYSVEAIYYHPRIIAKVAARLNTNDKEANNRASIAQKKGISIIDKNIEKLSSLSALNCVRNSIENNKSNDELILKGESITIENKFCETQECRKNYLKSAVDKGNWEDILEFCPLKRSGALTEISKELGLINRKAYEEAVLKVLTEDHETLKFVRELFGELFEQLNEQSPELEVGTQTEYT